jgi:hypothetical protein
MFFKGCGGFFFSSETLALEIFIRKASCEKKKALTCGRVQKESSLS